MSNDKESSAAGTNNRAPMLEENDYKSWKIRMKRLKRDEEFTAEENASDLGDIQAASILSQGYGLSEQRKKEELFDEYERFRSIGNESIHEYFIRFHKLANDLKITKIKIPTHQQNTNFLNNLPSYWAKYVTSVKQNQDISTKSYVELYTYLKAYEPHALKTLKKKEQSSSSVDPLAYLAHSSKHQTSTTVASPTSTSSSTLAPKQQAQSRSDAMMATMQQFVNLLSTKGNQGYENKTDRNGKKVICYNYHGEGHVARECKETKRAKDTQYYKDKRMLSFADMECTESYDESLALTTTTAFQVSHEEAYDFDIYDGPYAAAAFMANLSSTEEANNINSSKINENTELEQENLLLKATLFNKEESIKALNEKNNKVVSEKKDLDERNLEEIVCLQKPNRVMSDLLKTYQQPTHTIPMLSKCPNIATSDLPKTALGSSNPKYGNIARESHPAIYDGNRLLDPTHIPSSVWETEETIALGAESRANIRNCLVNRFTGNQPMQEKLRLFILIPQKRTADVRIPLDADISSSCVRELSKGLELEAEIAKKNKMLSESEK
nr:hypothetical protein [Tanacetum cinerariifolium]